MFNKRLIEMARESKKWIFSTVFMNWISLLLNIVMIMSLGFYLENLYKNSVTKEQGILVFCVVIVAIIGRYICDYKATKSSYKASANARIKLRNNVYSKLISLGVHYNDKISSSEIVQVAVEGIEQLEVYFGRYLPQFFYSMIAPLTLFIVLSFISIKTSVILILSVPLIPISIVLVMKLAKKLLRKYWGIYINLGDSFLENLQGLTTLKIYSRDEDKNREMNQEAENFRNITMKVLSMQLNSITVMDLIAFGGSALGIIICLMEAQKGNISFGGVFSIILLSSEFFIPVRQLGSFFHVAMNGIAASEKIFKIIDLEEKLYKDNKIIGFCNNNIELKNVNFSYEKNRKILKNVSISIKDKNLTALVGTSGCGKSTIVSLIMGLFKEYDGSITMGEQDLKLLGDEQRFNDITLVSHNSYIFSGTIEENLKMGKMDATEDELIQVLKKVNLYDFVYSMPKKLKSEIKDSGANLSGGQRQRLALARALLHNSRVYIFDEATSNIDVESENKIMEIVYELSKIKNVIVISHRLYNIKDADNIYVMENGEIIEQGMHKELMDNEKVYSKLVNEQEELECIGEENYA
ncbi:ABC transporter ATP-binding protein/permease [Hathewaya limosa]|uniref:ATP-binding cassette subfamily C protein n=1 Tax=Hathewaya limosa TaxID=1536 RepID=A0ABU0JW22_HATLI|nr:ABC transporter ATP-binding protein/permease [Hathewaya limosa]MDQ0480431.1 ATP-binding cassette subfamily C protein [Hathewaya limosa]